MRILITILLFVSCDCFAQSRYKELALGDSLAVYQCHVEEAVQKISTASGQTITSVPEKFSITEKFILIKNDSDSFRMKYYTSSLLILPNRKFSGLKIRERKYWNFKLQKDTLIGFSALHPFIAIEKRGRETTEYDFAITKYTTNQIIIKKGKRFRQLVIEDNVVLSKKYFPGLL